MIPKTPWERKTCGHPWGWFPKGYSDPCSFSVGTVGTLVVCFLTFRDYNGPLGPTLSCGGGSQRSDLAWTSQGVNSLGKQTCLYLSAVPHPKTPCGTVWVMSTHGILLPWRKAWNADIPGKPLQLISKNSLLLPDATSNPKSTPQKAKPCIAFLSREGGACKRRKCRVKGWKGPRN